LHRRGSASRARRARLTAFFSARSKDRRSRRDRRRDPGDARRGLDARACRERSRATATGSPRERRASSVERRACAAPAPRGQSLRPRTRAVTRNGKRSLLTTRARHAPPPCLFSAGGSSPPSPSADASTTSRGRPRRR
jgi:hypothetical protein